MLDWHGSGMSVMEMSHRGSEFISIADKAEADLRKLMSIGDDYEVLFLQGGAIGENAIVPMNLLGDRKTIDFINTGEWSKKSIKEAKKYAQVNIAASSEDKNFTYVPGARAGSCRPTPRTCTCAPTRRSAVSSITGRLTSVQCRWSADMSSHILSRPIDVSKYGVIYGGAQKNMGRGSDAGDRAQGSARSRARSRRRHSTGRSRRRAIRC